MRIAEKPLRHWIDNFYGYGSWAARYWFVSHEDGGGDLPEEVAEKLNYFFTHHPSATNTLCDIRDLYRHAAIHWEGPKASLYKTLYEYRFGAQATVSTVWKNLIGFAHGLTGEAPPDDVLSYQRTAFASVHHAREALIKLYPLPAPHHHGWHYNWLEMPGFPFLKSRPDYEQHLYPIRIRTLLDQLSTHKPEVVLFYGMSNLAELKKSVTDYFPEATFKLVKAVRQYTPQHHRADLRGTTLLITTQIPALRHNRVETGFDWVAFGKSVRTAGEL